MNNIFFKVRVECMTFNQAPYIEDSMNGFTMQQTDFPFVCTIIDDASTDGEQDVIHKYLQDNFDLENKSVVRNEETDDYVLCFAQHKSNKNCFFAVLYLKYNHYSIKKSKRPYIENWSNTKYIAFCEGDDYWISVAKLQKQVDFLDEQPHYSAVAGNTRKISIDGRDLGFFSTKSSRDLIDMGELVRSRQFHTASIAYRQSVYQQSPAATSPFGWDMWLWCCLISQGPIRYEDEVICVYRCGTGVTASTSRMKWILLQEEWENILFNTFSPDFITYNDAFFPLLADVFSVMNNKNVNKEDKEQLRDLFKKYITPSLLIEMMPMMLRHYVFRMKSFFTK